MWHTVYKDHKVRIDDVDVRLRSLRDDHATAALKINNIENNLPKMIRELVDFYLEQKVTPEFDKFVQKKDLKE